MNIGQQLAIAVYSAKLNEMIERTIRAGRLTPEEELTLAEEKFQGAVKYLRKTHSTISSDDFKTYLKDIVEAI